MDFEYELKKAKEKFGENSNVIRLKKIFPSRYVDLTNGTEGIKINNEFIPDKSIDKKDKVK